MSILVDSTQ